MLPAQPGQSQANSNLAWTRLAARHSPYDHLSSVNHRLPGKDVYWFKSLECPVVLCNSTVEVSNCNQWSMSLYVTHTFPHNWRHFPPPCRNLAYFVLQPWALCTFFLLCLKILFTPTPMATLLASPEACSDDTTRVIPKCHLNPKAHRLADDDRQGYRTKLGSWASPAHPGIKN